MHFEEFGGRYTKILGVAALSVCGASWIISPEKIVVFLSEFSSPFSESVLVEFCGDSFLFLSLIPFPPSLQITRSVSRGRESIGCIEGVELKGGTGECPCQPGKLQLRRSFILLYDPDWKQSDHCGSFNHFSVARDHSPIFTKSAVTEH